MRAYNFCAGPAAIPEAVLERAQQEMLDWHQSGMSIMEMSHRSAEYVSVAEKAEADLRQLLAIPANYKVLFLQGGATLQFSAIAFNLLGEGQTADYIDTGIWSQKAIDDAKRFNALNGSHVNIAASSQADQYLSVPAQSTWQLTDNAAYVHYTPNETIGGLAFDFIPQTDAPLIADFSSCILSEPLDVSRFGLIYAGAQKNIGPAGLTLVIVREDLMGRAHPVTPPLLNYGVEAKNGSMLNTPPTFGWYLSGLVFEWLLEQGGLAAMHAKNHAKAKYLYDFIDGSDFYHNPIAHPNRSMMNVPFTLADAGLEKTFLAQSQAAGLLNLAGHRSVGGMRASIYNAMPLEGVQALTQFMAEFAKQNG